MCSFLTILFFYFKCYSYKKWSEHYLLNNMDSFRIFLRIQYMYCSLGISLIVPQFCQNTYFLQLTLFLLSRAMHKLLTYFSFLKPCEMTTFYRENI
jgi:hypothetical protein